MLTSTIPSEIGNAALQKIILNNNQIRKCHLFLFDFFWQECTFLTLTLLLKLSGTISTEIGNMQNLLEISLNSNRVSEWARNEIMLLLLLACLSLVVFTQICVLICIYALFILQLKGIIPSEIGQIPNLTLLSLEYNEVRKYAPKIVGLEMIFAGMALCCYLEKYSS